MKFSYFLGEIYFEVETYY